MENLPLDIDSLAFALGMRDIEILQLRQQNIMFAKKLKEIDLQNNNNSESINKQIQELEKSDESI